MSTNFKPHPALLCDYYKLSHREQYPEGTEYIYSTWIPRKSIMPNVDGIVAFGFQAFVERYLVSYFKENFFDQDIDELAKYYERFVELTLGTKTSADHLRYLHNLGYLPLRVMAVPEGTLVPLRVPMLTIENTDPNCFWLTNYIETLFSNESWMASTSATIAYEYRKLLNLFADTTVGNREFVPFQGHDFSMRGMSGIDASAMSGAGHLLSFAGTDTIPAIEFLMQYYGADIGHELVGTSIPACYDDQTEILTENGFLNFKNLEPNIRVAQYHKNGVIDFVIPSEYFEDDYDGNMIHFESKDSEHVDIMVTPNHKMVRVSDATKELSLFEAGSTEYKYRKGYSHRYHLPVAGRATGTNRLSFIERLKIAFQADGSFPSHAQNYTGARSGAYPIRFSVKKDRKVKRLKWILDQSGTKYTYTKYDNGYSSFWINSPEKMEKGFEWVNLSQASSLWASDFIEECSHWDGDKTGKNGIRYFNSNKLAVEKVQAIATIAGYKTYLSECEDLRGDRQIQYSVNCLTNRNIVAGQTISKTSRPYFGKVYCVSVPSKMIIVRRNGQVAICGNTEHSVMCAYGRDELACYKRIITEIYPEGLVSIVSDTWDLFKILTEVIPSLKQEILNRDGRVVIRPDCYDDETEVMTPHGWTLLSKLSEDDVVAQAIDNRIEFVRPIKYISSFYEGEMIKFIGGLRRVDLLVTPNHRMVGKTRSGKEKIENAENFLVNDRDLIRSLPLEGDRILSWWEKILIAIQADATVSSNNSVRFEFRKQRKIDRLTYLCKEGGIRYKTSVGRRGTTNFYVYGDGLPIFKQFNEWIPDYREVSGNWCREFIEEVSYWDGRRTSKRCIEYFNSNIDSVNIVTEIAALAGYGTSWSEADDGTINLSIDSMNKISRGVYQKNIENYSGNVYCLQVPSGKLLVKRNQCTLISGNSGDPVNIICGDSSSNNKWAQRGVIDILWEIFGGTITPMGYKQLDTHIGCIYGDAITLTRCREICERLEKMGYASTNMVYGIGSFSYQYTTRDTFGFALKSTWAMINGVEHNIFKDPITDSGMKKSLTGRVVVMQDPNSNIISALDGLSKYEEESFENNLLRPIFVDGIPQNMDKLATVRGRLMQ